MTKRPWKLERRIGERLVVAGVLSLALWAWGFREIKNAL
jgi:hypothetical protein